MATRKPQTTPSVKPLSDSTNPAPLFESDILFNEAPKTPLQAKDYQAPEQDYNISFGVATAAALVLQRLLATIGGHLEWYGAFNSSASAYALSHVAMEAFGNVPVYYVACIRIGQSRTGSILGQVAVSLNSSEPAAALQGILTGLSGFRTKDGSPVVDERDWILNVPDVNAAWVKWASSQQELVRAAQ